MVTTGNQWVTSGNEWVTTGNQWVTSGNEWVTSGNQPKFQVFQFKSTFETKRAIKGFDCLDVLSFMNFSLFYNRLKGLF